VRAYRRDGRSFQRGRSAEELVDGEGGRWSVAEDGLLQEGAREPLERLPGFVSFWAGWYAFYPDTEIYAGR
jgi:hypothetical protein